MSTFELGLILGLRIGLELGFKLELKFEADFLRGYNFGEWKKYSSGVDFSFTSKIDSETGSKTYN
jgi:hypothetical protein